MTLVMPNWGKRKKRSHHDLLQLNDPRMDVDIFEPKKYTFYVGFNKFQLRESRNPVDYLTEYFTDALTSAYAYAEEERILTMAHLESNDNFARILSHIVCTILAHNKMYIDRLNLAVVNVPIIFAEPAVLVQRHDNKIVLYVSRPIVCSFFKFKNQTVNITYDRLFKQNSISQLNINPLLQNLPLNVPLKRRSEDAVNVDFRPPPNEYDGSCFSGAGRSTRMQRQRQQDVALFHSAILQLFVVADHAATHLLEMEPGQAANYVDHAGFGSKNLNTLHSALRISGTYSDIGNLSSSASSEDRFDESFILPNSIINFNRSGIIDLGCIRRNVLGVPL